MKNVTVDPLLHRFVLRLRHALMHLDDRTYGTVPETPLSIALAQNVGNT